MAATAKRIIPRLLVFTTGALLFASFVARLGIYWEHSDFFAGISAAQFLESALRGLRYDFAALSLVLLPWLVLMLLPGRQWLLRVLRSAGYVLFALAVAATFLFGIASTQFFAFFYRHLGVEVKAVFSDFDFILQMAVEQNLAALVSVGIVLLLALLVARRVLPKLPAPSYGFSGYGLRLLLIVVLGYFSIWGHAGRQWVDGKHAFAAQDLRLGALVQNPAFAAFNNLFFPPSIAAALTDVEQAMADKAGADVSPWGRPLLASSTASKPNIVLVVLESWTPGFIGSFGAAESVTPQFDQIVAQGQRFQQAYANGPISIYGLQALLTGMPHLPGMPLMGFGGVETLALKGIAEHAAAAGYQTLWAQASRRASFNMDRLASRWGFEQIAGREDYLTPPEWPKTPFGWDWPMYEYALNQFDALSARPAPFFATLYTAVTHVPYVRVPPEQQRRPHNPEGVEGFINTLSRADWALGRFWQQATSKRWHANTVYLFVADHVIPKDMPDKSINGRYRIPLAIVGPEIAAANRADIVSQMDVLPTLRSLLGQPTAAASYQQALVSDGAMNYWIAEDVVLGQYRHKPVFALDGTAVELAQEQRFLSLQQAIYQRYLALQKPAPTLLGEPQ